MSSLQYQTVQRCIHRLNNDEKYKLMEQIINTSDLDLANHMRSKMTEFIDQRIARIHVLYMLSHIPKESPIRDFGIWGEIKQVVDTTLAPLPHIESYTKYTRALKFYRGYRGYMKYNDDWNWKGIILRMDNDVFVDVFIYFENYATYSYIKHGYDSYGEMSGGGTYIEKYAASLPDLNTVKKTIDKIRMIGDELIKTK